jgi:hypothetical protein
MRDLGIFGSPEGRDAGSPVHGRCRGSGITICAWFLSVCGAFKPYFTGLHKSQAKASRIPSLPRFAEHLNRKSSAFTIVNLKCTLVSRMIPILTEALMIAYL